METMFRIPNKHGVEVDFKLNSTQAKLDSALTGRDIIPKARQEGVSMYFLGRYLAKCITQKNHRAVVISHEREATQRLLGRVHYMIDNMLGAKPVIENASKNEITFPKTGSMFFIGTAGAKKFGRGDVINSLHCSEAAFWEDAKTLTAGLFQAVPQNGEIAIESTGNGQGNWYHKFCMRAFHGNSKYRIHFFNWHEFEEYRVELTDYEQQEILDNLDADIEEDELVEKWRLSAEQIQFRRDKLDEMDWDVNLFKQEYPMTLDECFQASGRSIFHKVNYVPTDLWKRSPDDRKLHIMGEHPEGGHQYILGADVSAGIGQDASVVEIFDLGSMEQVAEWVDDRVQPDDFGHVIARLAFLFNEGFVTVENNNHGIVTLKELSLIYPAIKIYRKTRRTQGGSDEVDRLTSLGVRSTITSKPFAIGKLRRLLVKDAIIHSDRLNNELSTFVEHESGKLGAEEGCHDDTVIAAAMAMFPTEKAAMVLAPPHQELIPAEDPFSLEYILAELRGRRAQLPFEDQTGFPL